MLQLPKDYLSYIDADGSDSGFTEGDPGYFQLWALEEAEALNRDYKVHEFAPGFVGFGSDGGGELLAFDSSGAVFMIPFVGDGVEDAKLIGKSWSEIVSRITNESKQANKRPDGTAAKAPPSNPSQGAAVPHP